jgi:DNA repair exonuclease SbcCD nuclease subunit
MHKYLVISDLHLGVSRVGGTTAESAQALREYLQESFKRLLELADDVLVNGDLFDSYRVPTSDLFNAYETISQWLGAKSSRRIVLVPGNHCLSKNSQDLSSFELMSRLLQSRYPDQVQYLQGAGWARDGIYVISHVVNQEIFDLELSRVPGSAKYLLVHSNLDSKFAADAEHSLNLSRDQAKAITAHGTIIVMGHEHQGREIMKGKVIVVGNQVPSSCSDCMPHGDGQKNGTKRALIIEDGTHHFVPTWTDDGAEGWFARIDWRELKDVEEEGRGFVRVEGDASEAEAADVIKAISAFRQRSKSFVVTNAVKVEQADSLEDIAASIEDIRNVSVLELLLEQLEPAQQDAVRKLMACS